MKAGPSWMASYRAEHSAPRASEWASAPSVVAFREGPRLPKAGGPGWCCTGAAVGTFLGSRDVSRVGTSSQSISGDREPTLER